MQRYVIMVRVVYLLSALILAATLLFAWVRSHGATSPGASVPVTVPVAVQVGE